MSKIVRAILVAPLFAVALAAPAVAQINLSNLCANCVVGRLGIGVGPVQGIPFATLLAGAGALAGPGASVVNDIALWNNTTGSTLKDATGLSYSTGGPLNINPTAASTNQGIVITQTTGAGTVAGPYSLDTIDMTFSTPTITGSGRDAFGSLNSNAYGLRVNTTLAGSFGGASAYSGFISALRFTGSGGTSADKLAIVGTVYINVPVTSGGGIAGNSNWVYIDSTGSIATNFIEGYESDTGIATGGSAPQRVGVGIWNTGTTHGTTLDAAIGITSIVSGGEFQHLIALSGYANNGTLPSLASTADLFYADQAITIANVFNAGNFTVTGNILNFPGVVLTGAGNLTITNNSGGSQPAISLIDNSAATNVYPEYVANNGTNTASFGIAGTGASPAIYTGRGFVTGNGTGLLVGTTGSQPVVFMVNGGEVGRWDTSFGFNANTSQNAATQITAANVNAGASANAEFTATNGTNTMTAGMGGTGTTGLYGGRGFITANGAALVVGTSTANPLLIAINNVQIGDWSSATPGQLELGLSGTTVGKLAFFGPDLARRHRHLPDDRQYRRHDRFLLQCAEWLCRDDRRRNVCDGAGRGQRPCWHLLRVWYRHHRGRDGCRWPLRLQTVGRNHSHSIDFCIIVCWLTHLYAVDVWPPDQSNRQHQDQL
jgi:hypothetical protein